jgi:hypothetical protein
LELSSALLLISISPEICRAVEPSQAMQCHAVPCRTDDDHDDRVVWAGSFPTAVLFTWCLDHLGIGTRRPNRTAANAARACQLRGPLAAALR